MYLENWIKHEADIKREKLLSLIRNLRLVLETCLRENYNFENQNEDSQWSSYKERKGNALAPGAEEGRDKLRKAAGSRKWALIRRYPNGAIRLESSPVTVH